MVTQKKDDKLEPQIGELRLDVAGQTPKSLITYAFPEWHMPPLQRICKNTLRVNTGAK